MFLDDQANKYRALDNWFMTPQGCCVASAFLDELVPISEELRGDKLVQLGSCGENKWLPILKFQQKYLINPSLIKQKTSLIASFTALPIDRDSIDCVIAPLTLEAFNANKNPIDEIDRILKPMGYVLFMGVNPCSFWGLALRWGHLACFGESRGALTSSFIIKRMMLQRGYRQCALTSFYYIPPVTSPFWIKKFAFFNEMGKMIWPFPAGFYCLIMQKYQPASPDMLVSMADEELAIQQKSTLQAISKWIHD